MIHSLPLRHQDSARVKDCTQEWLACRCPPAPLPNGPFSTQNHELVLQRRRIGHGAWESGWMVSSPLVVPGFCSGKGLHSGVAGFPSCPSTEWSLLDAELIPWRIGHGARSCGFYEQPPLLLVVPCNNARVARSLLRHVGISTKVWCHGDCQTLTWELICWGF